MWLMIPFILVPMIEIGLFIQVGGVIGLWPTLAIVLLTAVAGSYLMRQQGMRAWMDVQRSINQFRDPTRPMAHGAMVLFAGALLLIPGFFTDVCGLLLLVPALRGRLLNWAGKRISYQRFTMAGMKQPPYAHDDVIDGEYEVRTRPANVSARIDPCPPQDGSSGWTRH